MWFYIIFNLLWRFIDVSILEGKLRVGFWSRHVPGGNIHITGCPHSLSPAWGVFSAFSLLILTSFHAIIMSSCWTRPHSIVFWISLGTNWGKSVSRFSSTGAPVKKNSACPSVWRIQKHSVAWRLVLSPSTWKSSFSWKKGHLSRL